MGRRIGGEAALRSSSWRSQPTRLPRPAWYHATVTCTSPWRSPARPAAPRASRARVRARRSTRRRGSAPGLVRSPPAHLGRRTGGCYISPRKVPTILLAGRPVLPGQARGAPARLSPRYDRQHRRTRPRDRGHSPGSTRTTSRTRGRMLIVGFTNHTDKSGLQRAHGRLRPGARQVCARRACARGRRRSVAPRRRSLRARVDSLR